MPVRVLVIDDHELFREAARAVVAATAGFEIVGEAATAAFGLELAAHLRPDVILIDAELPDRDGVEAAGALVKSRNAPLVVLVSSDLGPACPSADPPDGAAFVAKQALRPEALSSLWTAFAAHPRRVTLPHPRPAESRAGRSANLKGAAR